MRPATTQLEISEWKYLLSNCAPGDILRLWTQHEDLTEHWQIDLNTFEVLADLVETLRASGCYSESSTVADRALSIAYQVGSEASIAQIQAQKGAILMCQGEIRKAHMAFLDLLASARRQQDAGAICRAHLWLAYCEQTGGRLQNATDHAEECLGLANLNGMHKWSSAGLRYLGLCFTLRGYFREAKRNLEQAIQVSDHIETARDVIDAARTRLSLALVQSLSSHTETAADLLTEARETLIEHASIRDIAISYEYEAILGLQENNLPAAETAIREAVRISLEEFPDGDMTSQSYRIWAEIDVKKGDFEKAREHATDALGVARRVGERIEIGALERIFGQCDDEAVDVQSARAHFGESIKILSDCGARYELAHSYLAAGKANSFDRATRLAHLHSALALFREMEVDRLANEAEEAIRRLTSPTRPRTEAVDTKITVITHNQDMKRVLADLDRFKDTPHVILLEGETGVGKDLLAGYAHFTSARADRPFVEFNAAAVPEALVESELFGHVRGSFTGAMRDREGLLFAAKSGTFFFNEIGEAPMTFQAKLLTVIESRKARPVGANIEKAIEARLIFATNRDLRSEVSKGRFRKDLYFRLSTAHLKVPPLRERIEDIGPLLEAFLQRENLSQGQIDSLRSTSEWNSLGAWPWEGNVRELFTFAQRLAVEVLADARQRPELVLPRLMKRTAGDNAETREAFEVCRIESALKKHGGNKRRAAGELGIPESTLRWKITHLGIELP